jgi:DNA-binding CsgD family transcriptional regulator
MNLAEIEDCLNAYSYWERALVTKISDILEACEHAQNLMVAIYLMNSGHFLYCNRRLKRNLGENCTKFLKDGWNFWFSNIDVAEVQTVRQEVNTFLKHSDRRDPLTLWYHMTMTYGRRIRLRHDLLLHKVKGEILAINYFFDTTEKERIEKCFEASTTTNGFESHEDDGFRVSAREKQVLQLIANGFSSKEIADRLFISNHTAISHRKNLIVKFKVKNTAHLVKKASDFIAS